MELRMEPYAEDDAKLNDWVDDMMDWIHCDTFKTQEDWVYMIDELGEGRFPQFKGVDEVYDAFHSAFSRHIAWLEAYMFERWARNIRLGNVDLGEEMEWELRELMGDEYFEEWEAAAKEYIIADYEKHLGKERTKELFDKAWGEE